MKRTSQEMESFKHIAIHGPELTMTSALIKDIIHGQSPAYFPELSGKKGALFSDVVLSRFIDEEVRHDAFDLTKGMKRSILTLSSGERKKVLLSYLLRLKPDFLVIDNPFDALDVDSVVALKKRLNDLSHHMPIIQICKRREDLLPFINSILKVVDNTLVFSDTMDSYLSVDKNETTHPFKGSIPAPLDHFEVNEKELIRFTNVHVAYEGRTILRGISWTIKPGEFWQLKGPNGSGKTTMLTMITGDNPKAYGQEIYLFGKRKGSGESIWQIKKMIGYFSPAMMDLFKRRNTAIQMVVSGLKDSIGLYSKAGGTSLKLALEWLRFIGLEKEKDTPFLNLSQVQRRLILIARAMIKHPPLLILDEPSTGLDDTGAALLSIMINKMADESQTTIIYVSHRDEPGLKPEFIYQLNPAEDGSTGRLQ